MKAMDQRWKERSKSWGVRLIAVILILMAVFYGILHTAQSSKEPMRKGLEDYLKQATGHNAEITDLERVRLVPNAVFVMRGVIIRDKADPKKTLLQADQIFVAKPFLHLMFGINDFQAFDIKGLDVASGFGLPKKLHIESAAIVDNDPKIRPTFVIDGTYNDKPVLITADLQRKMKKYPLYKPGKIVPMSFKIGDLDGEGTLTRGFNDVSFERVTLRHVDMGAELAIKNLEGRPLNATIEGSIEDVPVNGVLTQSGQGLSLTLTPSQDDAIALARIHKFLTAFKADLGLEEENSYLDIVITKPKAEKPQEKSTQ